MAGVNINQGTQTNLATDVIGTVNYGIIKLDRGAAGVSSLFTGTIDAVTALAKGTISAGTINNGTINTGTVNTGTVDVISQLPPNSFATVINVGTSDFGTIKPAVAGSIIYVTDLTINMAVVAGSVAVYNGSTGAPIAGTWAFNANGGIVQNYRVPLQTTLGSALTYKQAGTASLSINVLGFVR
jgi:hypothetical protein